MYTTFEDWTRGRSVRSLGTNAGSIPLPFQTWRNFKEAYAPELVARAVRECQRPVARCVDPFGGSGTTALACQFLGIEPITIEVNPYLADLIEAKLGTYSSSQLIDDFGRVLFRASEIRDQVASNLPPTFIEPGTGGRFLFDRNTAARIEALRRSIAQVKRGLHRQLFNALLGGIVVDVSNVIVSGKGRRYRRGWEQRKAQANRVDFLFTQSVNQAVKEIIEHENRPERRYTLLRGDSRRLLRDIEPVDLAVFSPPYPNSFDYTDVYNVELWMLGYLSSAEQNKALRQSTLSSHVQVHRKFPDAPPGSPTLARVSKELAKTAPMLWNRHIPAMVDGYFAETVSLLRGLNRKLRTRGEVWAVVGDSLYSGIHVQTAKIIEELAPTTGFEVVGSEAFRSMRSSVQQGNRERLAETLIVLRKLPK